MIAKLLRIETTYYCSNCAMKQPVELEPYCPFCQASFSNFEETMIEKFKKEQEDAINE